MTAGSAIWEDSSSKRDSIWFTSWSSMTSEASARSGDDFHANPVLVGRFGRVLHFQDRVQRRDRHRELAQVGLARRELLELHARPHRDLRPPLVALAAEELDDLEGEAGDERDAD